MPELETLLNATTLQPGDRLDLSPVVSIPMQSGTVHVGDKVISDVQQVWLAHASPLFATTQAPVHYGLDQKQGYDRLQLPPGASMTLSGAVATPEAVPLHGLHVRDRGTGVLTETMDDRAFNERLDPYKVVVVTSQTREVYNNVPSVYVQQ